MLLDRTGEALGIKEIIINLKPIKIKTEIGDVRNYLKKISELKKKDDTSSIIDYQFDFCEKMVRQGNPNEPKEDVSRYVDENFSDLVKEITIALRLATRKDYEEKEELKN